MWPRNTGSSTIADELGRRRAGLGELSGDAADLHDRDTRAVGEHDRHLQDDLQLVADRVGGEVVEGLRAVAGLEHECPAGGDLAERAGQAARLRRRTRAAGALRARARTSRVRGGIRPWRLLGSGACVPRGRVPSRLHGGRRRRRRDGVVEEPLLRRIRCSRHPTSVGSCEGLPRGSGPRQAARDEPGWSLRFARGRASATGHSRGNL